MAAPKLKRSLGMWAIVAFVVLAGIQVSRGLGAGTILTLRPIWHDGVQVSAVLAGTTIVAFSFIGFDAVTMYTEEAKDERTVPRAIVLTVLFGGLIFLLGAWFAQTAFPTLEAFEFTDDTLPELGLLVGGQAFQLGFVAIAVAAAVASGLSSHASVSRLLYVIGRFIVLPVLGAVGTGLLWAHLDADAMIAGSVWSAIGIAILLMLTRGFRRPVAGLGIDEADGADS